MTHAMHDDDWENRFYLERDSYDSIKSELSFYDEEYVPFDDDEDWVPIDDEEYEYVPEQASF